MNAQNNDQDNSHSTSDSTLLSPRILDYDSLHVMNFLVHPVWIFDFCEKRMRWANTVALELWDASTLEELQHRNFHDISEANSRRMQDYHCKFQRNNHNFVEQYTLYPKGVAKTVQINVSGVRLKRVVVSNDDNNDNVTSTTTSTTTTSTTTTTTTTTITDDHFSIFCESIPLVEQELLHDNLRGLEMLRHLPIAVCQFDMDGHVMFQNPCAAAAASAAAESVAIPIHEKDDDDDEGSSSDQEEPSEDDQKHQLLRPLPQQQQQDYDSVSKLDNSNNNTAAFSSSNDETLDNNNIIIAQAEGDITAAIDVMICQQSSSLQQSEQQQQQPSEEQQQQPHAPIPSLSQQPDEEATKTDATANDKRTVVVSSSSNPSTTGNSSSSINTNTTSGTSGRRAKRKRVGGSSLLSRFVDRTVGKAVLGKLQTNAKHNQTTKTDDMNKQMQLEAMMHTHDGPKWSAVQLQVCKDPVTGANVILYSALDNSDAVRAQQEKEARERKSEFLAIMAHEIRTPLHQVTGFIDLLHETELNAEQKSYVKLLRFSAQGLMTVISDVLDYSKLEAGKMKLECIPYEPKSVVETTLAAVRGSCDEKGLDLTLQWSKEIPFRVLGDPNRLRQILLNLLSNSVKFTTHGGITVSCSKVLERVENEEEASSARTLLKSMVKFAVQDTGIGIEEEHRGMIFNDYYQGDASVARTHGGTGLGLSICKLLVSRLGGTIGVESEFGSGSCFWFCLPAEIPKDCLNSVDATVSFDTQTKGENKKALNVLIAEDNRVNQKLLKRMLERMGHRAVVAEDGMDAIEQVEARKSDGRDHFDVVLMDIQMPKMDGLEATRRLRSMGYSDLPIYGLTASVGRSDYAELGFDDWLPKPIPMKELREKLSNIRLHSKSDDEN